MNNPMLSISPVYAGNAEFIEDLYERYLTQPTSVSEEWRQLFATFKGADSPMRAVLEDQIRQPVAESCSVSATILPPEWTQHPRNDRRWPPHRGAMVRR